MTARPLTARVVKLSTLVAAGAGALRLIARGAITIDTGVGRRLQPLGPRSWTIAAPREVVFDEIAAPYLRKTPVGLRDKLEVWERGTDMALAAHFTSRGRFSVTTTVETIRFDEPQSITFRLLRGPVPHVAESFELEDVDGQCQLTWKGELGTDFWAPGALWGKRVAHEWEKAVARSLASIAHEAERRSAAAR